MSLQKIDPRWKFAFTVTGGRENCDHEYDEDKHFDDTEYTGTYYCEHCNAKLEYDVSDIGD